MRSFSDPCWRNGRRRQFHHINQATNTTGSASYLRLLKTLNPDRLEKVTDCLPSGRAINDASTSAHFIVTDAPNMRFCAEATSLHCAANEAGLGGYAIGSIRDASPCCSSTRRGRDRQGITAGERWRSTLDSANLSIATMHESRDSTSFVSHGGTGTRRGCWNAFVLFAPFVVSSRVSSAKILKKQRCPHGGKGHF